MEDFESTSAAPAPVRHDALPATFVLADLAGYTALTEAHGDEHAADTAAAFVREVRQQMAGYDGQEVKTIGDALLLRITDPRHAVELAHRIVVEQTTRHRTLGVRVGMHTGNAVCRDGDWFGAAVNLAARIADQANAGEVVMSAATVDAAGEEVRRQVRSRGKRHLKNVARPVELFVLSDERALDLALPIDPVCRMSLDPAQAHSRTVYRGAQYHFCSADCAQEFARSPQRFADRARRGTHLRVSDRARDDAARAIARAYAKGRIDADELDERTERAWAARTRADLAAVTHDLPRRRRGIRPWQAPFFPLLMLIRRLRRRISAR